MEVIVVTLEVLLDEVRAVRRLLERMMPPPLSAEQQRLLDVLAGTFDAPFTSAEVLELARMPLSTRQPLRDALAALGVDNAQRLGLVLGELVKRSATMDVRIIRMKTEAGSRTWFVERSLLY